MVWVGSVWIENVFATTLTDLPDVPYWRAGDTLDVDCMVYVCFCRCECKIKTKNEKMQNAGVQDGGQIENGAYANGWQSNPAYSHVLSEGDIALRIMALSAHRDPGTLGQVPCLSTRFERVHSHLFAMLSQYLIQIHISITYKYKSSYLFMMRRVEASTCANVVFPSGVPAHTQGARAVTADMMLLLRF